MGTVTTSNRPARRARGFIQAFGLSPASACLVVSADAMAFGADGLAALAAPFTAGVSLLVLLLLSLVVGSGLGFLVYRIQRRFYGDDKEAALIKALALGFLTALPFPLPLSAMVSVPAGAIGWLRRRKEIED